MTEEITDEQVKSAIRTAARSLARSEQCRAALERKLLQKEFDENSVRQALDFLEKKHYLDDERFAASWIRTHCTYKPQGRIRILRELLSRGVKKNVAENAIRDYFSNIAENYAKTIQYEQKKYFIFSLVSLLCADGLWKQDV